jgi:hypothetical protein
MADDAARYNMSMGLKNSISLISKVQNYVQFAVNEECVKGNECSGYRNFLAKGKPVFHIEYTGASTGNNRLVYKDPSASTKKYCNPLAEAVSKFSTIIKPGETLGPAFLYCDGKPGDTTPIRANSNSKNKSVDKANFETDSESADESDSEDTPGPARGHAPKSASEAEFGSAAKPIPEHAASKSSGSRFGSPKNHESSEDADSSEAEGPDEVERETDSESSGSDTDGEDSDNDADDHPGRPGRIRVAKPNIAPKVPTAPN